MILEHTIGVKMLQDVFYYKRFYKKGDYAEVHIQDIVHIVENDFAEIIDPKMKMVYSIAKKNFENKNKGGESDGE